MIISICKFHKKKSYSREILSQLYEKLPDAHLLAAAAQGGAGAGPGRRGQLLRPARVAIEAALELVAVADERLDRVLGAEAQRLGVQLLRVAGHPVVVFQVRLLLAA